MEGVPRADGGTNLRPTQAGATGTCRAKPSKRAWIPKAGGKRPLGIAALEDKIVQQAVRRVLEEIFEVEFLGLSSGFRPGRSAHDGLDALWWA